MKSRSSRRAMALAITPETKEKVWERDGGRCVWCGTAFFVNPEAHYIPQSKGGLGIEKNILTLCRQDHDRYDNGSALARKAMREYFREYLSRKYPDWNEDDLIYRKEKE